MTKTTASARVTESIRQDIAAGRLKVGDRLPSRQELCAKYGIAAMTAARVVRALAEEGLVVSDVGRGVFVTAVPQLGSKKPTDAERLDHLEARVQALEDQLRNTTE